LERLVQAREYDREAETGLTVAIDRAFEQLGLVAGTA
jgi:hypothetical protein